MKLLLKWLLPQHFRLRLRVWLRFSSDWASGRWQRFSSPSLNLPSSEFKKRNTVTQPVKSNQYALNKLENIKIALQRIEKTIIQPNEIFSFWHLVPQPLAKNGYQLGRSILGNELSADYGGGLCQLSGIIYILVLEAGLEVMEHHAHSHDLYNEQTRYTPLGSDATVAYGHKDLRFRNTLSQPLALRFTILPNQVEGCFISAQEIDIWKLDFNFQITKEGKQVTSHRTSPTGEVAFIAKTFYKDYTGELLN